MLEKGNKSEVYLYDININFNWIAMYKSIYEKEPKKNIILNSIFLSPARIMCLCFYRTSSGLTAFESSKNRCESLVTFLISWLSIIRGCLRLLLLLLLLKANNLSAEEKRSLQLINHWFLSQIDSKKKCWNV